MVKIQQRYCCILYWLECHNTDCSFIFSKFDSFILMYSLLTMSHNQSAGLMITRPSMLWVRAPQWPACLYPWVRYLISICFVNHSVSGTCHLWGILQSKCRKGVCLAGECPKWSEMIVTISWWCNNTGNSALNP